MQRIVDLNIEYINLRKNKISIVGGHVEIEKFEERYLMEVLNYAKENNYSKHELIQKIGELIIGSKNKQLNEYLLIKLIWKVKLNDNSESRDLLGKLIRRIIAKDDITNAEEYYLESYLDIWNQNLTDFIPIDILEPIILMKNQKKVNKYGALIKAVSYLSDHPESQQNSILNKAKKTDLYREDDYYKEWIG